MVRSRTTDSSRIRRCLFAALATLAFCAPVAGVGAEASGSGLPVPRFVSLRASEVNLRTGPGRTYPVEWVYQRRHIPVEVVQEFDTWRKIRDFEGTEGWVHQSMLDGRRYVLITGGEQILRQSPDVQSTPVARVQPGVIARLLECQPTWCEVEAGNYVGWLLRESFWGAYPNEVVQE